MSQNQDTHTTLQHTVITKTADKSRTGLILTIALIVFALAAVSIFFLWKKKDNQPAETAQDIRNIFTPPTTAPSFTPPLPTPPTTIIPSSTPPAIIQPPVPTAQLPPPQPAMVTYSNSTLGFQLVIPSTWQAQVTGNSVFFFDQTTGKQEGYVESYPNNGSSLNDLQAILSGSPSISSVSAAIFNGQPALRYTAYSVAQNGIAFIANNTIYYIRGLLAADATADSFQPMSGTVQQNNYYNGPSGY